MSNMLQRIALTAQARKLLLVFLFMGLASPLVGTFTNIFLWRQGKSLSIVIAYMLAYYACLPLGFFVSYRLLGRLTHRFLFAIGMVATGVIPFLLIFSPTLIPGVVVGFGALYGVASGFLWSTRNYLTLTSTTKKNRLNFSAMEGFLGTLSGITVPFIIGWALEIGSKNGWFSLYTGYRWMGLIGLILLTFAGFLIYDDAEPGASRPILKLQPRTHQWKVLRALEFAQGLMDGLKSVLGLALVFSFLGAEGAIGTVGSVGALISVIVLIGLGRCVSHERRMPVLAAPIIIDMFVASLVFLLPQPYGVIAYLVTTAGMTELRWWVTSATMYHAIEVEERCTGSSREGLLLDRERILNVGRAVGLGVFFLLYRAAPLFSVLLAPFLIALTQVGLYPLCKTLDGLAKKQECVR